MSFLVDIEASRALASWKNSFANQVTEIAKRYAIEEGTNRITVFHYRQAVHQAMLVMENEVQRETTSDSGWEEAALGFNRFHRLAVPSSLVLQAGSTLMRDVACNIRRQP